MKNKRKNPVKRVNAINYTQSTLTLRQIHEARERFAELLREPNTKEIMWQQLFTECPYILSMGLPLKLLPQDIQPLARPGRSEPDFIFYPQHTPRIHHCYGVIELKTPQSNILITPRKNLITLSSSASTAVAQANTYLKHLNSGVLVQRQDDVLFIGTNLYVFIIMGLTQELRNKLVAEMLHEDLRSLLPDNFMILPYDSLYSLFEANITPRIMVAVVPILAETTKPGLSSNFIKCPKCQNLIYKTIIDRWYVHPIGCDSDGEFPRYVVGYQCSECGNQYEID